MKLSELKEAEVKKERPRIFLAARGGILLAHVNPLTGQIQFNEEQFKRVMRYEGHLGAVED
jgi:hypothetical protein